MNRNVESHFSMLPSADIQRSRFDRSQDVKFTGDVGSIYPVFWDEILPGDSYDITTSKVIRLQTLLAPVMDNLYADFYWFFVPNRLVHTHFQNVMGENTDSAWIPEIEYTVPQIILQDSYGFGAVEGDGAVQVGDILDYLGVPVGVSAAGQVGKATYAPEIQAYPLRAYQKIYEDWFRDENLVDPVNMPTGDTSYYYYDEMVPKKPYKAAKFHDYLTSQLPSPQKGPSVQVPTNFLNSVNVGGVNYNIGWPVSTVSTDHSDLYNKNSDGDTVYPLHFRQTSGEDLPYAYTTRKAVTGTDSNTYNAYVGTTTGGNVYPDNLFAMPATNDTSGIFIDVNDLRYAFQLQKLYERDARGGSRYIELLRSHFSIISPDARLQRSEYLGGNRIPVSIHQVTNQSQGENDFLGDLGAMSLTTDKHSDVHKSFVEHGVLMCLMVLRYDHSYPQALNRMWKRKSRFDYYWPVFANLGEQATKKSEIMLTASETDEQTFGYNERWAEYRYKPNEVHAEMRPGISNSLDVWHFADYYETVPSLSQSWIEEDKSNVDRTLAVTSEISNQFFADVYVQCFATRPMPLYSIPGLVDHH